MLQLPLDVLINILSFLPPVRTRSDKSALTLAACLQASCILREAAHLPSLWKPHYDKRFEHCEEERERSRRETYGTNWRLLYVARRQLDNVAIQQLEVLLQDRTKLRQACESVLRLSMDVWDVLEIESLSPASAEDEEEGPTPPHAYTRRHLATSLLETLTRGHAVATWYKFWLRNVPDPTFEETMNSLSCFYGHSKERIRAQLDQLTRQCRQTLLQKGITTDPTNRGYSSLVLCREVCFFMKGEGFLPLTASQFHEVMNRFPHLYLTTHKNTIPICLVHVFAAIGTRLGLEVYPVNYPGTVLAYVVPREPNVEPIIVNPSTIFEEDLAQELSKFRAFAQIDPMLSVEQVLQPCGAQVMLLRANRNIITILQSIRYMQSPTVYPCVLLVLCTLLLFEADDVSLDFFMSVLKKTALPLDFIFLLQELCPILNRRCQSLLQRHCEAVLEEEAEIAKRVRNRSVSKVKYFLGMPCIDSSGQLCFISGWERVSPSDCTDSDYDITPPGPLISDRDERERYHILTVDGRSKMIFLFEGNLTPATFTKNDVELLFSKCRGAAVYFGGVQLPKDPAKGVLHAEGRGRLLLSPHALCEYPEDDAAGSSWIDDGFLS